MSYLLRQLPARPLRYYCDYSGRVHTVNRRGRATFFTLAEARRVKGQLDQLGHDFVIVDAKRKRFVNPRLRIREENSTPA